MRGGKIHEGNLSFFNGAEGWWSHLPARNIWRNRRVTSFSSHRIPVEGSLPENYSNGLSGPGKRPLQPDKNKKSHGSGLLPWLFTYGSKKK
jgi:hypothetical protein